MDWNVSNVVFYVCLIISAVIMASDQALRQSAELSKKVDSLFTSPRWGYVRYVPLLLLIIAGMMMVIRANSYKPVLSSSVEAVHPTQRNPVGSYQYRNEMPLVEVMKVVQELNRLFKKDAPLLFVITAPRGSASFQSDFFALLVVACQLAGDPLCVFKSSPDPTEIDSGIPPPEYPGIVIHHEPTSPSDVISQNYMWALGHFIVRRSSYIPDGIALLNDTHDRHFYWFELGLGCPWKDVGVCGR